LEPKVKRLAVWLFVLFFALPLTAGGAWFAAQGWPASWRSADWSSAGIAPDPAVDRGAIVQVYAARAGNWRGIFAVHSWILLKPENATAYSRYEVTAWGPPVHRNRHAPDGRWYGNTPRVIYDLRGEAAAGLIPEIEAAIGAYPHNGRGGYRIWPGPNSNSFTAAIARAVPGFDPLLPPLALGKDYVGDGVYLVPAPSGTGWQISLFGVFGVTLARREGLEVNLFGLVGGVNPLAASVSLPSLGRVDLADLASTAMAAFKAD
jgi:hypothetical protein